MCYRETAHYVVLCDRCGLAAPEGTGWWTPTHADRAALEAGWEMTATEHLCPTCAIADVTDNDTGAASQERPALPPATETSTLADLCWPASSTGAVRSWAQTR